MESMALFGGFLFLMFIIMLIVLFQQYQQNIQFKEIQDRLREMRRIEALEQEAAALRREKAALLEPLNTLEAQIFQQKLNTLTPEELMAIDDIRGKVKERTDSLKKMGQWMGPPFDLEWPELLEHLPIIKQLYTAASFVERPTVPEQTTSSSSGA